MSCPIASHWKHQQYLNFIRKPSSQKEKTEQFFSPATICCYLPSTSGIDAIRKLINPKTISLVQWFPSLLDAASH